MNRRGFFGLIGGALVVAKTDGIEKLLAPRELVRRKLKVHYSIETLNQLRNIHGLDAHVELENVIRSEIAYEIGREQGRIKGYPDSFDQIRELEKHVNWNNVHHVDQVNPDSFILERTYYYEA